MFRIRVTLRVRVSFGLELGLGPMFRFKVRVSLGLEFGFLWG